MSLKWVTFATGDEALKAYESGRCDPYTTDASGLYGERLQLSDPGQSIVLPEIISKEPLSAVVRQDDNRWSDIVRWTHFAMVDAEELGSPRGTSTKRKNRMIRRPSGYSAPKASTARRWVSPTIGPIASLSTSAITVRVSSGIWARVAAEDCPWTDALWMKGGLQYAPPIR